MQQENYAIEIKKEGKYRIELGFSISLFGIFRGPTWASKDPSSMPSPSYKQCQDGVSLGGGIERQLSSVIAVVAFIWVGRTSTLRLGRASTLHSSDNHEYRSCPIGVFLEQPEQSTWGTKGCSLQIPSWNLSQSWQLADGWLSTRSTQKGNNTLFVYNLRLQHSDDLDNRDKYNLGSLLLVRNKVKCQPKSAKLLKWKITVHQVLRVPR